MSSALLIDEIRNYADGRKSDVARGAETPALAALLVEKYGEGMAKTLDLLGQGSGDLLRVLGDLVGEIDPQYREHRQLRFQGRPVALSIRDIIY